MSSDDTVEDVSPIPKRRKYKMYKQNPNIPVPLRTLDRWAARRRDSRREQGNSRFIPQEEFCEEQSGNSSAEVDISDDAISLYSDMAVSPRGASATSDDASDVSNYEINNIEEYETSDDNDEIIVNNTGHDTTRTLLYENSTITVDEAVFNLLDYYLRHKLLKSALENALKNDLKLLPPRNRMPKTVFKLLQYVEKIAPHGEITKHYFCRKCSFYIGIKIVRFSKCPLCAKKLKDLSFFFEFNIEDQLRNLFENNNLARRLTLSPLARDENIIRDITDGTEYKRVNSRENRGQYDLTLISNTDGISLVKSRSSHCWPLMYTIAELPEHSRESSIIILGLWYDSDCKPNMNTFLQPFCVKLQQLYDKGFEWTHPETRESFISKVVAPLFIADAPARANLQNVLSHKGVYGCNICEIMTRKCKKITGKKRIRIYPFEQNQSSLRTSDRMEKQAKMQEASSTYHIKGVKGFSILSSLPLIDLGACVLPEYMHSVLLGVVRQYIDLLLNKRGAWNIKKYSKQIDNLITEIRPPQSFNRLPREITQFKQYKASEFYNWILFYSLPTLIKYLPNPYFEHLMLLVIALFDLLQDEILIQPDLLRAEKLLDTFVELTPKLYGDREMTYNHHQLRHLGLCVRRWHPLRSTSAFPFENENGYIAECVHGTKNMGQEIINNLKIVPSVQILKSNIAEDHFVDESYRLENYKLLGNTIAIEMQEEERQLIVSEGLNYQNLDFYARAAIFHTIYTSANYKVTKTNSSIVGIRKNDGSCSHGIIRFLFDNENDLYFITERLAVRHDDIMSHSGLQVVVRHIIPIVESGEYSLIKLSSVRNICQYVRVGNYICKRPDQSKRIW